MGNRIQLWVFNIEGLARNFRALKQLMKKYEPEMVMVSETWALQTEQKLFEVKDYERAGTAAIKGKKGGRPSGGMMEYVRKNIGWIMELEKDGEGGERIRTVKVGGRRGHNQLRLAIIGVYGPQRTEEEKVEKFYDDLDEKIYQLRLEGWRVVCAGDFNIGWKRKKNRQMIEPRRGWKDGK